MSMIDYTPEGLLVRFPGWEAAMAGREAFLAPPGAIDCAQAEPGWSSEVLGFRSGLVVSGYRKVGTFLHPSGTRRLVSMKRGLPLLRVQLDRTSTGFDEALLSTPDAVAIAREIGNRVRR